MKKVGAVWVLLIAMAVLLAAGIAAGRCIEHLADWGTYLTGVGTIALALAALYAGLQAVREYGSRTKSEHMRSLSAFFREFYENTRFRRIRQKIDFGEFSEIKALLEKDNAENPDFDQVEKELFDDFTDYLNFFEMVAYWIKCGQIAEDEAKAMFDYYLRRLVEFPDGSYLLRYLREAGFEYLSELLVKYPKAKKA
jgi:hypothetical protein